MTDLAKLLIVFGIVLIAAGLAVGLAEKFQGLPKLPGDIMIKKDNFSFYFPITTSLVFSVLITLLLNLWSKRG